MVKGSTLEYIIPGLRAVTSDISDTPDDLLDYLYMLWLQKVDEVPENISLQEAIHMIGRARRDICQAPSSLKLELGDTMIQNIS